MSPLVDERLLLDVNEDSVFNFPEKCFGGVDGVDFVINFASFAISNTLDIVTAFSDTGIVLLLLPVTRVCDEEFGIELIKTF